MINFNPRGIPQFGSRQAGIEYILRPSVYAIIQDAKQKIAIVKHKDGFFLPGGGIELGETPVEALRREIIEEIGYQVTDLEKRSEAVEYLPAISGNRFYHIYSTFFVVQLDTKISVPPAPDHQLIWMTPEDAVLKMQRPCHQWAIENILLI